MTGRVWIFTDTTILSVNSVGAGLPVEFGLKQNFPNPFYPVTKIEFAVPRKEFVRIRIYDAAGRKISVLFESVVNAGNHVIQWNVGSHSAEFTIV